MDEEIKFLGLIVVILFIMVKYVYAKCKNFGIKACIQVFSLA